MQHILGHLVIGHPHREMIVFAQQIGQEVKENDVIEGVTQ